MNTDPAFPLIDRYLDGLATDKEAAALAEAVEADPDVLAALCEVADIEASLRRHLATREQRQIMTPRIVPLWHWRRAGKWLAIGAAAAALVVSAALTFWPTKPGSGGDAVHRSDGMVVRRFIDGARNGVGPAQAPVAQENAGPMEEVEFQVHAEWDDEMTNARPPQGVAGNSGPFAGVFEIPVEGAAGQMVQLNTKYLHFLPKARTRQNDYLVWYLRACGVTFPPGASAHWLKDQIAFVAVNTISNIERIKLIQKDPAAHGARPVVLFPLAWITPHGGPVPELLQTERILSSDEVKQLTADRGPRPHGTRVMGQRLQSASEAQHRFLLRSIKSGDPAAQLASVQSHLQLNQWRVGDHIFISGVTGPRPDEVSATGLPEVQNADMEFELTLTSGQAAVLHLGQKADGNDWYLILEASISEAPVTLQVGTIPNVMKFDQTLLKVKAGSSVRLLHKNDACVLLHNFVLVKPGAAAAVGALADQMLRDPDALAKLYIPASHIPASPDILVTGTRLLKRGESEEILFTAPEEPGDYPYLCTFPGHWRLQQGILRVER